MHTTARFRVAASLLVIMTAAACGSDSTGPSQSPSSVAAHFDSLYVDAVNRTANDNAYSIRSLLLTLFEVPPAAGASPATISVTTASGVEHWKAFEIGDVFSPTDSTFFLLAYRESAVHTALVIQYAGDGSIVEGALLTNDTLPAQIINGSGSTTLSSTSSTCGTPSSSLVNPSLNVFEFATCTLAKFKTSVTISTVTSADIDPALASIALHNATVNGVRIVDAEQAATLRRLQAALHAASRTTKRF
jgi:hypothetical protein